MILNSENFMLYAAHHYDIRRSSGIEEFNADLKRFQYLKRLFRKYEDSGELNIRLVMNHLVVVYNCFGSAATPMLCMKLYDHLSLLKPCLIYINQLPPTIEFSGKIINSVDIPLNQHFIDELRKL